MSSSVDTDVNITINAKDNASSIVDSATKKINKNWKEMHDQQRAVRREFELNNRGLVTTARAIQSVGSMVNRAISLYNTWNIMQIRVQDANRNVYESQQDLNEVLDEYGQDSPQFRKALEANQRALEDQKKAQDDAKLGMGLLVTSLAADATRIITDVVPKFKTLRAVIAGTSAAAAGATATSAVTGASTTAAGSAAGATTGAVLKNGLKTAGKTVLNGAVKAGPAMGAAAVVSTLSMMGEQTAGENDLPSGIDQIPVTINFIVKSAGEAAEKTRQAFVNLFSGGN